MTQINELLNFLDQQVEINAGHFSLPEKKCLSFLGTSPESGKHIKLLPRKILDIKKSDNNVSLDITLEGKLGTDLKADETISVSIIDTKTFTGYQIKEGKLLKDKSTANNDVIEVKYVYTIHHTPNTSVKFENIPYDEVISFGKKINLGIVGVGASPNISPRFIALYRNENGKLKLFFANSSMNKTHANFIKNKSISLFVPDLNSMNGYILYGTGRNIQPGDDQEGFEKPRQLFLTGGWGEPRQVTECTVDSWEQVRL